MAFTPQQSRCRFYNDDGSATAATAAAAENAGLAISDGTGDKFYHFHAQVQNSGTTNGAFGDAWALYVSKNNGAYSLVTTTSGNAKAFDSINLSGATTYATTDFRLTPGSGSAVAGTISETGDTTGRVTAGNYRECLFTVQLVDADLAPGDTLDFRLYCNGAPMSGGYAVTPRITVQSSRKYARYSYWQ